MVNNLIRRQKSTKDHEKNQHLGQESNNCETKGSSIIQHMGHLSHSIINIIHSMRQNKFCILVSF